MQLKKELNNAEHDLKKARSLLQMDELKCRKRVLRRLGYATSQDVIERKGRVACELSAADELLITEMLFNGLFNNLSGIVTLFLLVLVADNDRMDCSVGCIEGVRGC